MSSLNINKPRNLMDHRSSLYEHSFSQMQLRLKNMNALVDDLNTFKTAQTFKDIFETTQVLDQDPNTSLDA